MRAVKRRSSIYKIFDDVEKSLEKYFFRSEWISTRTEPDRRRIRNRSRRPT